LQNRAFRLRELIWKEENQPVARQRREALDTYKQELQETRSHDSDEAAWPSAAGSDVGSSHASAIAASLSQDAALIEYLVGENDLSIFILTHSAPCNRSQAKRPTEAIVKRFYLWLLALPLCPMITMVPPQAAAQVSVNSANPNSTAQSTVDLDVIVSGSGFKKGAKAQWFVSGTTNPGGVTVNSTSFNNSGQLTANISVSATATTGPFDIQVTNTDGRTGKGTELFAVKNKVASACIVPAPLNIAPVATGCANPSGSTCLDSSFGNTAALPPGGLVLTNTDGSVPSANDLDAAQAVFPQQMPDGTSRVVAIGATSNPNVSGQQGIAVLRYNTDGALDAQFGTGGVVKFFPPNGSGLAVRDGVLDPSGNVLAVADAGGTTVLARFTSAGILDTSFHTNGYVTLSALKPSAMALQTDGKILVAGTRIVSKTIVGSVARFNSDGSPDSSFGTSGQTNLTSLSLLYSVALQTINSQQYIVAGGGSASTGVFSVARITPVGTLDTAFGSSAGYDRQSSASMWTLPEIFWRAARLHWLRAVRQNSESFASIITVCWTQLSEIHPPAD